MTTGAPTRVVLLGGGYVALHAYRAMVARGGSRNLAITVISADDCHNFHGFTGEVVAGLLPVEVTRTPLAAVMPGADVIHARIIAVGREGRVVTVQPVSGGPARTIEYDELIVATGGREPLDRIPGMAEHGYTLRAPGEFERLLEQLSELVTGVGSRVGELPVAVVGAGMAGVELAAAIADRLHCAGAGNPVLLLHSGSAVLPVVRQQHPRVAARAERELARLGVQVVAGSPVARVVDGAVEFGDGTRRQVAVVLATTGQRAVVTPGLADLPRDDTGRLLTDPYLRVEPGIWAAGDAARIAHPGTGAPVPANALWAIKAGAALGRNISRTTAGRPPKRLRYRGLGQAMAFGVGRSATEMYGIPIAGATGWVLRLGFFLRFMPQRRRAARVVGALLSLPFRGRFPLPAGVPHRADASRQPESVSVG